MSHGYATRRCEQHNRKIADNCTAGRRNAGYSIMNLDAPPEQSAQAPNGMPLRQCVPNTSSDLAINIELLHLRVLPRFYGHLSLLVVGYLCSGREEKRGEEAASVHGRILLYAVTSGKIIITKLRVLFVGI